MTIEKMYCPIIDMDVFVQYESEKQFLESPERVRVQCGGLKDNNCIVAYVSRDIKREDIGDTTYEKKEGTIVIDNEKKDPQLCRFKNKLK